MGRREAGGASREPEDTAPAPRASRLAPRAEYLGVGCFSTFAGFAGGGMIAVLLAKIIGFFGRCTPDTETGAPCNWFTFAVFGALIGAVVVPTISIWFFRRGRIRELNERG